MKSRPPSHVVAYSDDPDATWVRKGKRPYYGYKAHVAVGTKEGFVLDGHVTRLTLLTLPQFEKLLEESNLPCGAPVLADKGQCSMKNRCDF